MIAIFGCGGHARSIADVALFNGQSEFIFIDNNAKAKETIYGQPVFTENPIENSCLNGILAIGDNLARKKSADNIKDIKFINIISKQAYVSDRAQIGQGIFIAHFAYIGPSVHISDHTIINTGAIIEHEVTIGDFSHIAPNVTVAGRVIIGNNVFIGAGSTVVDKVKIISNVVIGANSTVIHDIFESGVYIGSPARKIK